MREENTPTNEARSLADSIQLLTTREARMKLRISQWKLYDLFRARRLDSVRIGRRRFVPVEALRAYIQQISRESFA
ncbi:helix-turn-helix domain-containing protein [Streptomyces microflavus]|uniref:helix-turn-helix domain-containing protein n=1 Tax=Streptomyces microflavus TaxID=1919 RepID=UPI00369B11B6